ncbi:MAG: phosphoglycerate dehydrogenase [Pirellulales bacterium]|nr:phosphoglycerate dehydrogenase [Pirellulales bacterium]
MHRIIILDKLAPVGLQLLQDNPAFEVDVRTGLAGEELGKALADYDGAVCRSGVTITPECLVNAGRLKAIVRAGVGTDNIDLAAATRAGVVVMNTPSGNTVSTAEHTIALILALSRNVGPAFASLKEGRWDRGKFQGSQLAGKTLGIVGLGRIGQAVARRAQALEMRILGYDPFLAEDRARELGIEPAETVAEMLPRADYLTVHTPLTDETRDLISVEQIEQLKPGVRLINCARGGIYDEAALVDGLKSGRIGGVALDVFAQEPCTDSPLFQMPGVLATPHLGASTEEAQAEVAKEAAELLTEFLTTGGIRCAVNVPAFDAERLTGIAGFLNVSHRLGRLMAQWPRTAPSRCRLRYRGDVSGKDTKLVTAAFAAGLLEQALEQDVNLINAELLLRERGIELATELSDEPGTFRSLIMAEVTAGDETLRAAGTTFGNDMYRLVQLNGFRLEAYLDGCLLMFQHRDVPGIIGAVGKILGEENVNIAQMAVGRASAARGGDAIGVLNLDDPPSRDAVERIGALDALRDVRVVTLPAWDELPSWLGAG